MAIWVINWAVTFKIIERAIFIITALAALVPIWQFLNEADDRKLDRAASLVTALAYCDEQYPFDERSLFMAEITVNGQTMGPPPDTQYRPTQEDTAKDLSATGLERACADVFAINAAQLEIRGYSTELTPIDAN